MYIASIGAEGEPVTPEIRSGVLHFYFPVRNLSILISGIVVLLSLIPLLC
ncbi:hypothetical protein HNQ34_003068 [Anoxybacillus tepidamans]|uniref:Uncharacterized protein n=1 Tax=Anoxybacteroides tepidamans TaxID=265948 RepID=A0A7W8MVU3_9BACL|nr:hypothetical protein [Anoxybacillus tepidamans]